MNTLMIVSGGEAPGVNAVLARCAAMASGRGDVVFGARGGFAGAFDGHIARLDPAQMDAFAAMPGSVLPSSRAPVLSEPGAREKLAGIMQTHAIDNLILFGGDGTLRHVAPRLASWGVPCIVLPTTIDNDVPGTERTLGFDSACNYAYYALDGMRATAHALAGRIFTLETLGGDTGFIALAVAHGAGAHAVLLPEYEYADEWLTGRLRDAVDRFGYALLVLSEGVPAARTLAAHIPRRTGFRVRDVRLGHAQRGATPSHRDRVLAAEMAQLAYNGLRAGLAVGVVVVRDEQTQLYEGQLKPDTEPPRMPNHILYERINGHTGD